MRTRVERCKRLTSVRIISQRGDIWCLRPLPLHFGSAGRFEAAFFVVWPVPFTVGTAPEVVVHAVAAEVTIAVLTPVCRPSAVATETGPLIPIVEVGGPRWSSRLAGSSVSIGIHGRQPEISW